ncbi:MAG TPA: heterodisulfide reductase-related iron-sulfur binding cluster [Syntrophorhabdaceae bacterium]|nr:heterodisulfide reductase-related iron-sulfur binding cluster [Syntrophorhabdaceae bacterium]
MLNLSYYPGCSLKTSSRFYEESIKKVFTFYQIELKELDDWSCCGASAAHTVHDMLSYALAARNLALAEKEGIHMFTPCSACYNRCKTINEKIRQDRAIRDEINNIIAPLKCSGSMEVKSILEVFMDYIGLEKIGSSISFDLSSLSIAPYYGCVLTRITDAVPFDDVEDPRSMDNIIISLGARVIPWQFKMECCGAAKTITDKDITFRLTSGIMTMAKKLGAHAIVTTCPLCQLNLDLLPLMGKDTDNIPVLFLSELFELAIFGRLNSIDAHIIETKGILDKIRRL